MKPQKETISETVPQPDVPAPLPLGAYDAHEPQRESAESPNVEVARGVIEEGIRESVLKGERFTRVTVNGERISLGQYLAGDLYKLGLTPAEIERIHDRYLGVSIETGEVRFKKNPNAALGRGAVGAARDYDFRERQAGSYKEDD